MSERDARVGRRSGGRRHAGDDLHGDARLRQRHRLLAHTAEETGIAALEAHHALALPRQFDQPAGDLVLGLLLAVAGLAHAFLDGSRGHMIEDVGMDEGVVDDRLRPFEEFLPPKGEKAGISRPRTDEIDETVHRVAAPMGVDFVQDLLGAPAEQFLGQARPMTVASPVVPFRSPRTILLPSRLPTSPRRSQLVPVDLGVACDGDLAASFESAEEGALGGHRGSRWARA